MLVNRYEILGRIGSGGMADVYKATDHKLNRFVAVKVMKPEFSSDSTFIKKFKREAQAAAGLANPNIVNVYDVGEDEGNNFIVMELVEGITLKEYIAKKGKLSVREATSIAIQVCMGLAAAHDQGIVHRDVKPQNIIISTDGKVKVTDFGIARAASSNTISANAMGSVHYSSPEQVRGGYSDARSDIYSLGITLYEMVTGRVPFDGETTVAIAIKHLQDEMDAPSKYTPDLPYALEQIIYKCTQKNVDRRYQTMQEVIADLKHSLMEPDGHFVMLTPLSDHAQTVMISDEEREAIRQADTEKRSHTLDHQTFSSIDAAKKGHEEPEYDEESEEDDYDDYEDDDEDVSSGLEKAVTIGSFIVCAMIVCVLIYFLGRAGGFFKVGGSSESGTTSNAPTVSTAELQSGQVAVPSLIGMTEEEAADAAGKLNLGIKYQGEKESDQPEGTIIEQNPTAGTAVDKNSTIYYYKSAGQNLVTIPSGIVGSTLSDAQTALQNAGLNNVTVNNEASESVAVGRVISITPGEGEEISASSAVTLLISSGSAKQKEVSVISYVGMSFEDAKEDAEEKGLIVAVKYGTSTKVGEGEVMAQSIESGSKVNSGSTITLTVNDPDQAAATTSSETTSSSTTSTTSSEEEPVQSTTEVWSTTARLGQPSNYEGGAYRLELIQTVNGTEETTTVDQGDSITFPYTLKATGAAGVADGTVYLYEKTASGEYVARVTWPVTFTKAN